MTATGAPLSDSGAYFEHSEFRARLDELREACAIPGQIVVVTGPAGAGKSVVCEALLAEIDPPRCAASVCVSLAQDPLQEILAAILEAYGFKVEPGTGQQVMSELIAHHAADPAAIGRQCVVVVDDAHQLPMRDLHALLALIDGTSLTLVLAGPMNLVPAVERVAGQFGLDWREVRLTGLSIGEVNTYLEWRQSQDAARAGRAGALPFTDDQVRELTRRSQGLPGRIEQLLAKLHASGNAGEAPAPGPFGFPMRHLVVLAALALILLLVYIVGQFAEQVTTTATTTQRVETLEMPPLPTPEDDTGADAAAWPPVSSQIELPAPARGGATTEEPAPAPRPIISRQAPASGAPPQTQPQTAAAPATPTATPAVSTPAPAPTTAAIPPASSPASAAAAPAPAPARSGAASKDASWILAQPAGSYTLQLVSLSSAERARSYIAQQPDPGSYATYRLMRNGQLFHVVVYGAYPSKAQADQAAARLPRSVGNIQPWVRQFGQVQESVRTTAQQ